MKRVAILQSNYIPWKGYFDMIAMVDEFIFYDEMQYTRNDWRNRNKIKTDNGSRWLTIPVYSKGFQNNSQLIKDTIISDNSWSSKHWNMVKQYYKNSKYFNDYKLLFEELFLGKEEKYLCEVNYKFIRAINEILGIKTKLSLSSDYQLISGKTERLIDLVKQANGTEYISGPAAKDYIDADLFSQEKIQLSWMDYSNYPEYEQFYPPFEHGVTILDLIFNCGKDAINYMKMREKR